VSRHLRLALFLCLGLLVCGAQAASPQATAKQKELDNLRKRITNLQRDLEKTSESQNEAADALRESERAISDSNRRLADLNRQRGAATQSLQQLQTQGAELKLDIQEQQNLLGRLLYQQYLNGSDEYLKLLLNNRDPNQVAREIQYHGYIARDRAAWLQSLRDKLDRLQQITEQTQHKSDEIASLQTEARTQQQSLEKDKRTRQQVLNKISTQLKKQRSEISRLQRDENNLSQLVDKLSKMLAEPKRGGGDGGIDNDKLPDDRFDGKPFAQLKGKLILPVKGKVTNRYGTQRPDSTVSWKGLFLRAPANAQVKAVAAGRVVFADWLRGFGNLLIIDHGKGYMSLYGNNETLYKQVGEVLHGGDVVAAVGNTGGNAESGLYFEIRYNGQTQDPMKWVAR
jgi:septal ring factor EnvC (AmiA/AmiB activator)